MQLANTAICLETFIAGLQGTVESKQHFDLVVLGPVFPQQINLPLI